LGMPWRSVRATILLQMATAADRGGRRQVRRRPSQFSFRQLPTSPASDAKSRIGVAIQGRDGAVF
jgi:hypothetical protein